MSSVAVIDYGMGNLHSIAKALAACRLPRRACSSLPNRRSMLNADRVVFPGVGCDPRLHARAEARWNLIEVIRELRRTSKPFLGICLGMQALLE